MEDELAHLHNDSVGSAGDSAHLEDQVRGERERDLLAELLITK